MTLALQQPLPQDYVAPMPSPWKDPGFAQVMWVESPNFNSRPATVEVDTVVLHSTVIPTLERTVYAFNRKASGVSAHFTIGKDGSIVQHVSTFDRAWHAGTSRDHLGRDNVNAFSIGIELVNLNDGADPYPDDQIRSLQFLLAALQRRHDLRYLISHEAVAIPKGRKSDPAGFPWETMQGLGLELIP
jgi:N-acetylmuramoyl-L-alanine amidase